jgi:hypothetical protein
VRRPQAFDRRLAAGLFSLVAIGVLLTAGLTSSPTLPLPLPDRGAARELVALMRAGEGKSWLITYDFTRTLANGRQLRQTMEEGRSPRLHVLSAGSAMTIESPTRTYSCTLVGAESACHEATKGRTLPESEVLRVAIAAGAYGVTRRAGATIAGEHARCFRVLATGRGGLPDVGVETDVCLATDGITLRDRVVHATGDVDERTVRVIRRDVATADVEQLARGFDPERAAAPR